MSNKINEQFVAPSPEFNAINEYYLNMKKEFDEWYTKIQETNQKEDK